MIKHSNPDDVCCKGSLLERPRYFPHQLVTPGDMNLAQEYFRKKLRLHNLMLHGRGGSYAELKFAACPIQAKRSRSRIKRNSMIIDGR